MARRKLPVLTSYRQSVLSGMQKCPRRVKFDLLAGDVRAGWVDSSGDLGSIFHAIAARILQALKVRGMQEMPWSEAREIMYEVAAEYPAVLPTREFHDLHYLVEGFCRFRWDVRRILAIEEQIEAEVMGQDGALRMITGHPDILLADPPDGVIIIDYKSGRGKPKSPRGQADAEHVSGRQYLSERGLFQLDCYGALALRRYPQARRATLKEYHLRTGQVREATLERHALPEVERQLGIQAQQLEMALAEGPKSDRWYPKPGDHCGGHKCPVARSCPIPREMRGLGAVDSSASAKVAAAAFVVAQAQYRHASEQVKAFHEGTGEAPVLPDGSVVGWLVDGKGGRKFGVGSVDRLWQDANGGGR